jgi:hypothetical protein
MVLAAACGDWDEDRADEDRWDHDIRLSRASDPRVAGPRLRSSYLWSVVSGEVFPLYCRLSWRIRERSRLIMNCLPS